MKGIAMKTGKLCHIVLAAMLVPLLAACSLSEPAKHPKKNPKVAGVTSVSPQGHEPIKATVVDKSPGHYTIDVKKFANMSADQEAPTFAVYVTGSLPAQCGDFRKLDISYKKPTKYERQFDFRKHKDILKAIDEYGCVVIRNKPSAA